MTSAARHVFFVRIAKERAGVITSPPLYLFVITSVSSAPHTIVITSGLQTARDLLFASPKLSTFFHDLGHILAGRSLGGTEGGGVAVEQPQQVALEHGPRCGSLTQGLKCHAQPPSGYGRIRVLRPQHPAANFE